MMISDHMISWYSAEGIMPSVEESFTAIQIAKFQILEKLYNDIIHQEFLL